MDAAQETFLACDDLGVSIVSTCWGIYKTKPERVLIDIFKISGASHFNEIEKKKLFFLFCFCKYQNEDQNSFHGRQNHFRGWGGTIF